MYPRLSAAPLAGPGLSRSGLGPCVPSHRATSCSRPSGSQGRHGVGRADDRQPSGQTCGIPPGSPTMWPQAAAAQLYFSSAERLTVAPQADLGYALTAESVWQVCLSACWSTPEGKGKRAPLWRDGESPTCSGVHPRGRTQGQESCRSLVLSLQSSSTNTFILPGKPRLVPAQLLWPRDPWKGRSQGALGQRGWWGLRSRTQSVFPLSLGLVDRST